MFKMFNIQCLSQFDFCSFQLMNFVYKFISIDSGGKERFAKQNLKKRFPCYSSCFPEFADVPTIDFKSQGFKSSIYDSEIRFGIWKCQIRRNDWLVTEVWFSRDVSNTTFTDVPGSVEHVPGSVEHVPGSVEHVPGSVEHVSGSVEHVPGSVEHVSGSVEHVPGSVEHVPGSVEHVPGSVEHVPGSVEHVPESVEHVPGSVEHVPGSVEHVPGSVW